MPTELVLGLVAKHKVDFDYTQVIYQPIQLQWSKSYGCAVRGALLCQCEGCQSLISIFKYVMNLKLYELLLVLFFPSQPSKVSCSQTCNIHEADRHKLWDFLYL